MGRVSSTRTFVNQLRKQSDSAQTTYDPDSDDESNIRGARHSTHTDTSYDTVLITTAKTITDLVLWRGWMRIYTELDDDEGGVWPTANCTDSGVSQRGWWIQSWWYSIGFECPSPTIGTKKNCVRGPFSPHFVPCLCFLFLSVTQLSIQDTSETLSCWLWLILFQEQKLLVCVLF